MKRRANDVEKSLAAFKRRWYVVGGHGANAVGSWPRFLVHGSTLPMIRCTCSVCAYTRVCGEGRTRQLESISQFGATGRKRKKVDGKKKKKSFCG